MKFILTVNNMFVKSASIDSYDGTTICTFTSNMNDARKFLENEAKIIKGLIENLLKVDVVILTKTEGGALYDQNI